ncbi:MAG: hypothetical protein M1419_06270 [Bacteroidetes bacterium]|nr:hypothetical protein [Bacteroidota bacterium]
MRHVGIRIYRKAIIVILLLITLTGSLLAQFSKGFSLGWGMKTTELIGSNPASKPFSEPDPNKPPLFGGGFDGPQPGMELLFEFPVGENNNFTIPLGIDYTFFQGLQRIPLTYFVLQDLDNRIDISSISLGLNYAIKKYDIANAKFYVGLEAKTSFVGKNVFTIVTNYRNLDSIEILESSLKESCVRLGGSLKLGLEGEIAQNWYVNIHGTLGILNLVGRNDSRGELLTPYRKTSFSFENQESLVFTIQYSFLIQYRL